MATKKRKSGVLQWLLALKTANNPHIVIEVDESNKNVWHVVVKAEAFEGASCFQFQGDNGFCNYEDSVQEEIRKVHAIWLKEPQDSHEYFLVTANAVYSLKMDSNGEMTQTNEQTNRVRTVRKVKSQLMSDIEQWFNAMDEKITPGVHYEIEFPNEFPLYPPFVRVICPRFQQWTGHVTIGGSVCTELLVNKWDPDITATGLMLQLQDNIINGDPPGKIDHTRKVKYSKQEAEEAFQRAVRTHGWTLPGK